MRYLTKILNITVIVTGCIVTLFVMMTGIYGYFDFKIQAQQTVTEEQIIQFIKAIEIYKLKHSAYPSNLKIIQSYLTEGIPQDPWGSEYIYELSKENGKEYYKITSYGADKKPGGVGQDADIFRTNRPIK